MQKGKFQPLQKGRKALQKAKRHTFAKRYSKPCKRQSLAKGKALQKANLWKKVEESLAKGKPLPRTPLQKGQPLTPCKRKPLQKGCWLAQPLQKGHPCKRAGLTKSSLARALAKGQSLRKDCFHTPCKRVARRDLAKGPAKCSSA